VVAGSDISTGKEEEEGEWGRIRTGDPYRALARIAIEKVKNGSSSMCCIPLIKGERRVLCVRQKLNE